MHEFLPGERLGAEQRVHRVVDLQQTHRVEAGQADAQDWLDAFVRPQAGEAQIEVQQKDFRQRDGQDFERSRFGHQMTLFDQIERHFGVEEIAARQARQVGSETGHLALRTAARIADRAVDFRTGRAFDTGHGHVTSNRWAIVDAMAGVVHQVLVWPVAGTSCIQSEMKKR